AGRFVKFCRPLGPITMGNLESSFGLSVRCRALATASRGQCTRACAQKRWGMGEYDEYVAPLAAWVRDGPRTGAGGPDGVPDLDAGHAFPSRSFPPHPPPVLPGTAPVSIGA